MTGNIPLICVYRVSGLVQSEVVQPRVIRECGQTSSKRLAILTYKMRVLFHRWTQRCVECIGNAHCVTDVWTHIESRQFIGWWRDAVSDAITSSAHTGERAIHSSDFSAFTKRSHYPSLLRFSGPTYLLRSSICTSATASLELCSPRGEVPWSFAAVNRRARVSSLAKMKELRLHPTVPATRLIRVSRSCCQPLLMWRDPVFLRSGVRMGAIHRRHMITTDASMTGWDAVFEGRPASGEWKEEFLSWHINCLELRAVFLALKYFLPVLGGYHIIVRMDNMAVVSHINRQGGSSSPLVPRQVPLFEGGSRSGNTEPCGRFSVETEAQAGGMDVDPSDGIPDLGSVWQSGGGPLCFSRVIPVPALVLPEFPDDSGHRCVRSPMAECQSVRVSANKADSVSTMQSEGERCPSPSHSPILALPDLVLGANSPLVSVSLGDSDQADLLSQLQGKIWHPQPELWKLWVWPIQGQGLWLMFCLPKFRKP